MHRVRDRVSKRLGHLREFLLRVGHKIAKIDALDALRKSNGIDGSHDGALGRIGSDGWPVLLASIYQCASKSKGGRCVTGSGDGISGHAFVFFVLFALLLLIAAVHDMDLLNIQPKVQEMVELESVAKNNVVVVQADRRSCLTP